MGQDAHLYLRQKTVVHNARICVHSRSGQGEVLVKMYAAYGRRSADEPWQHVTLFGQIFMAQYSLIAEMVAAMKRLHQSAEFEIREVEQ